jgi:magnesium transporter
MIFTFPAAAGAEAGRAPDVAALRRSLWIDLLEPTAEDAAAVHEAFGLRVPTRGQLEEIEASSRLRAEGAALYMSSPLVAQTGDGAMSTSPIGVVLAANVCLTVRYAPIGAIEGLRKRMGERPPKSAAEVLAGLLEEVVDRAADRLERAAQEISEAARVIYAEAPEGRRKLSSQTSRLRRSMLQVGRASDRLSQVRYVFVSIGRMAAFVVDRCPDALAPEVRVRLDGVHKDIASLDEFEASLTSRVQLLHDAATGFIGIEQNEVVKVLTIASVVGVPPVLVVGVYGMNFKIMPELAWSFGYPYALLLMVVSAVVPLVWFKFRGWL